MTLGANTHETPVGNPHDRLATYGNSPASTETVLQGCQRSPSAPPTVIHLRRLKQHGKVVSDLHLMFGPENMKYLGFRVQVDGVRSQGIWDMPDVVSTDKSLPVAFAKRASKGRKSRLRVRSDDDDEDLNQVSELLTGARPKPSAKRARTRIEPDAKPPVERTDDIIPPQVNDSGHTGPPLTVAAAKDSATRVIDVDGPRKSNKGSFGPQKATLHIRSSIRFDYQPDVCKDFKETGYCGFGDACKFLHDRSNYKSGWEQDKSWQVGESGRRGQEMPGKKSDEHAGKMEEPQTPFACHICRKPFTRPVQTICGHIFCEACALQELELSEKCVVCNTPTRGIYNTWKSQSGK